MPSLEAIWDKLENQPQRPVYLRVDEVHPLDLYVGNDAGGERVLLIITGEEPHITGNYRALQVAKQLRHDNRWALTIKLNQPDLKGLFAHLCQDLVDSSSRVDRQRSATSLLIRQLEKWQRLMARGHEGILTESEIRGLFAELVYLEECAIPFRGSALAIEGWVGPLEADQDFRLGDRLAEIKACAPGASAVCISSMEQLDVREAQLFLIVITIEGGTPGGPYVTLNELIARIRNSIVGNGDADAVFDERLTAAGYVSRPEYGRVGYNVLQIRHYIVTDEFPRIITSAVPPGVLRLTYEISLSACSKYQRETSVGS